MIEVVISSEYAKGQNTIEVLRLKSKA